MDVQLPFLVAHGETIYRVAAVAAVLFSIWSLWRGRLRLASVRTKDFLAELGPVTSPANFAAGSPAVVKGVIEFSKDKELVGVLFPSYSVDTSERIDLGAGVTLKGESSWQCEGLAEVLWAADLSLEPGKLRAQVHAGEEVHLKGTLQALPSSSKESASYREASIEWRLVGTKQQPLQIVSTQPPRPRIGVLGVVLSAMTGLAAFSLGVQIIGAASMDSIDGDEVRVVDGKLEYPTGPIIAAAMPFHREEALYYFSYNLSRANLGELGTRAGMKLDMLQGECPTAALRALEANLWDEAKKAIGRCPASEEAQEVAYKVYFIRGEFAEASSSISHAQILSYHSSDDARIRDFALGWSQAATIHILAGNYTSAAEIFEREAEMWGNATPAGITEFPTRQDLKRVEADLHCLAIAARQFAGQDAKQSTKTTMTCQMLQAAELEPTARKAHFSEMVADKEFRWSRVDDYISLLSAEAGHLVIDGETLMFRHEPNIVNISDIANRRYISSVPLYLGVLNSAYEAVADQDAGRLSRAAYGLELGFWKAIFGEVELAQQMFVEAKKNLLLGSAIELGEFAEELAQSPDPLKAEHARELSELREISEVYEAINRLIVTELGLAALASKRGDLKSAQRHVDFATAYTPPGDRGKYFGKDGYVRLDAILGKTPLARPYSVGYECREDAECTPSMQRASSHIYVDASYLDQAIGEIVERKAYVDTIDAPQWQAELHAATDKWTSALYDRDRSLLLGLVNYL